MSNWYESPGRGYHITKNNHEFLEKLFQSDYENGLFKDRTAFCFFAFSIAIINKKEPKSFKGAKMHEVRSEFGVGESQEAIEMAKAFLTYHYTEPITLDDGNIMDPKIIPLKCITSLTMQGIDLIADKLQTEVNWHRFTELLKNDQFSS
jgi:hypothetical protein